MSSNINPAIPPFGNPTTAGVRANFQAASDEITELQRQIGFADYADTETAVTPISVPANTWRKLTNNTLGTGTRTEALPAGITTAWDAVANQLDLSEFPVDTMVELRADMIVTTSGNDRQVRPRLRLAIGTGVEFSLAGPGAFFKAAGAYDYVFNMPFYIGSNDTRNNPGEIQIWSDGPLSVVVRGWYIRIIKRLGD